MKVLVIGGAGYLGSVLCRKLLEKGYEVKVLDSLIYGDDGIKMHYNHHNFEFVRGDIRNLQTLFDVINDVDAVINLAAIVGDSASNLYPDETMKINYLSAKMIAEVCKYRKIKRFIFASTASVYGKSEEQGLLTEESEINPLSLYAKMKLNSEKGILELQNDEFTPTILRMGTLYGLSPRMRFDLVVNLFTMNAYSKGKLEIFGGTQKRCLCHIEDATDAYIKCLECPLDKIANQIFNVSSHNIQISGLGKLITDRIGDTELIINEKEFDERSYITSSEKIKNAIGWKPVHTIEEFVDEINPDMWRNYLEPKYDNYKSLFKHIQFK